MLVEVHTHTLCTCKNESTQAQDTRAHERTSSLLEQKGRRPELLLLPALGAGGAVRVAGGLTVTAAPRAGGLPVLPLLSRPRLWLLLAAAAQAAARPEGRARPRSADRCGRCCRQQGAQLQLLAQHACA